MHDYKKVLQLNHEGKSQRMIASLMKISRHTISDILKTSELLGITYETSTKMSNEEIYNFLYPDQVNDFTAYLPPDYKKIHEELLKPGVTLSLLWLEYQEEAKSLGKPFYHRSYFFEQYKKYVSKNNLTMHISHKPGDKMMVDWDGKTLEVKSRTTGEISPAYLFVATLPFSMKTYVRACPNMKEDEWIRCHIEAYKYFGGVTRLLIPDNLKTGVISHKKHDDLVLNKAYQEMAEYYDTVILPARVRKPRDKAAVEGSVGVITNYLFGRFRNRTFFSFEELNKAIKEKIEVFNNEPFQKREGSRSSIFEEEEKGYLKPLPLTPFEICTYPKAKVNIDYHVSIDKMNYSVPCAYVGQYVDAKVSDSMVTIFYKNVKIAEHKRLKGRKHQYSTIEDHLPEDHKMYKWNGERLRKWALSIGNGTYEVIDKLLKAHKAEEVAYRGCISLLKLADKYSGARVEKACKLALEHLSNPGYKNIKMILESGQDNKEEVKTSDSNTGAFIRGKEYYGTK